MRCDEARPLLAELLVGALPRDLAEEALAHVRACTGCGVELGELSRVEEDLVAAPARRGSFRLGVGVGVTLGAAAAAIFVALTVGEPAARLLTGQVAGASSRAVPRGVPLTARTDAAFVLPCGSRIDAEAGTEIAIDEARRVRIARGLASFDVQRGAETFVVDTPRGTVRVLGTRFQVGVLPMRDTLKGALAGAAVTIVVGSGVVLFRSVDDGSEQALRAGDRVVARPGSAVELQKPAEELARATKENESLRAELETARRKATALEERVAVLASEVQAARQATVAAPPPQEKPAEPARTRPPISFGSQAELPELAKTDWAEAAQAVRLMHEMCKDIAVKIKKGESIGQELGIKVAKENAKLQKIAFALNGKIPTNLTGNGEFTHPIVIANLIAKHVDLGGRPLDDVQAHEIARMGEEYDARWKELQARYTAETLKLEKVMDELELKQVFVDRVFAVLTPEQQALVIDPSVKDVYTLDIYSPSILVIGRAHPIPRETREAIEKAIIEQWSDALEVSEEEQAQVAVAVRNMVRELEPTLVPLPAREAGLLRTQDLILAGRAQVAAMKSVLPSLAPDSEMVKALRGNSTFYVPRLTQPKK